GACHAVCGSNGHLQQQVAFDCRQVGRLVGLDTGVHAESHRQPALDVFDAQADGALQLGKPWHAVKRIVDGLEADLVGLCGEHHLLEGIASAAVGGLASVQFGHIVAQVLAHVACAVERIEVGLVKVRQQMLQVQHLDLLLAQLRHVVDQKAFAAQVCVAFADHHAVAAGVATTQDLLG
uniref:Vps54 domain-containing protein n=1 Tax=Steinernema glaseri TaxID=37863 RepID=A0A1I7YB56_9BILA